jgi:hypothetical protein
LVGVVRRGVEVYVGDFSCAYKFDERERLEGWLFLWERRSVEEIALREVDRGVEEGKDEDERALALCVFFSVPRTEEVSLFRGA